MVEAKYITDNCYKWTFKAHKVRKIVEKEAKGRVLNLFAGKIRLNINETRVDISHEFKPEFCMPAEDFLKLAMERGWRYDTVIYDPPWNERKSKEFYNGEYIGQFTKLKDDIVSLLHKNGKIISVGYEITNFGRKRNMDLKKVFVIDPRGEIRPYFISIEMIHQNALSDMI